MTYQWAAKTKGVKADWLQRNNGKPWANRLESGWGLGGVRFPLEPVLSGGGTESAELTPAAQYTNLHSPTTLYRNAIQRKYAPKTCPGIPFQQSTNIGGNGATCHLGVIVCLDTVRINGTNVFVWEHRHQKVYCSVFCSSYSAVALSAIPESRNLFGLHMPREEPSLLILMTSQCYYAILNASYEFLTITLIYLWNVCLDQKSNRIWHTTLQPQHTGLLNEF